MAISYPLSLPTAGGIARVRWTRRAVVAQSASPFTGETQTQVHQGQWWEIEVSTKPMVRADAAAWEAWHLALNGKEGTFLFGDPLWTSPRGTATGTPLVKGASQTGQDIETDGWTPEVTGILKAGDMIQLGSGSAARLHMQLVDTDSDGSGNATLTLWPHVRSAFADNTPITVSSPKGLFRLSSNEMVKDVDPSGLVALTFAARSEI